MPLSRLTRVGGREVLGQVSVGTHSAASSRHSLARRARRCAGVKGKEEREVTDGAARSSTLSVAGDDVRLGLSVVGAKANSFEDAAMSWPSAREGDGEDLVQKGNARRIRETRYSEQPNKTRRSKTQEQAGRSCGWRLVSETGTCNKQLLPSSGHMPSSCARATPGLA